MFHTYLSLYIMHLQWSLCLQNPRLMFLCMMYLYSANKALILTVCVFMVTGWTTCMFDKRGCMSRRWVEDIQIHEWLYTWGTRSFVHCERSVSRLRCANSSHFLHLFILKKFKTTKNNLIITHRNKHVYVVKVKRRAVAASVPKGLQIKPIFWGT